jgi:molybdate transport system permease protein
MSLTPLEIETLLLSLKVASVCVAFMLPLSLLIAWALARKTFPGHALLNILVHLPLVVPPVVVGYTLLVLLGRKGVIGQYLYDWFGVSFVFSWTGAVIATSVMALPLMVRALKLSFDMLNPAYETVALTLGASKIRVFLSVTLPLLIPGILSAITLGFARAVGEFGATITFVSNIPGQTRTLPIAIYSTLQIPGQDTNVVRLVLLSLLLAFVAIGLSEYLNWRQKQSGDKVTV